RCRPTIVRSPGARRRPPGLFPAAANRGLPSRPARSPSPALLPVAGRGPCRSVGSSRTTGRHSEDAGRRPGGRRTANQCRGARVMEDLQAEREFRFTTTDFERVRSLIHARAGISLAPSKKTMVYSRLSRRLRELGLQDFESYLGRLRDDDSSEWGSLTNALTTNLTSFFREPYHFPVLAERLEQLAGRRERVRIWCAAASTGEEPYSIAMTAVETLGERPPVSILASDIDTRVLSVARAGIYAIGAIDALSPERCRRFMLRGKGAHDGFARIRPDLASLVDFRQINLVDPPDQLDGPFDA